MSAADLQEAVQYLLFGLGAYLLVAVLIDHPVSPLEVGVFLAGIGAILVVGRRLMAR